MGTVRQLELSAVRVNVIEGEQHKGRYARPKPYRTKTEAWGDGEDESIGAQSGDHSSRDEDKKSSSFLRKGKGAERMAANRRVVLRTISEMDELKTSGGLDRGQAGSQKVFEATKSSESDWKYHY